MAIIQNGSAATGWKQLDGSWYYFDEINGNMITGWREISGVWYYFKKNDDGVNWSGPKEVCYIARKYGLAIKNMNSTQMVTV